MKKFLSTLAVAGVAVVALASCTGQGGSTTTPTQGGNNNTTTNGGQQESSDKTITVWVSESAGVKEQVAQQIKDFDAANDKVDLTGWKINVEGVSEADSATLMITDVESGADIFCFAQDQLARLVEAKALNKLSSAVAARVTEANDAGAIKAASVAGELYCYPLTSDNGYFMYYDKSVVKEEHIDSLEDILADCVAADKLFSYECDTSAWYNAGWFFATGCTEEWTTNDKGVINAVKSTFNSDNGVIALRGMQHYLKSKAYNSSSSTDDFAKSSAVVVSGTWGKDAAVTALGENYAVADLPSFTVDGKSYHLGSFSGNKLMGVKPQTDATKGAICQLIAEYLTNATCQEARFDLVGWGPSNKAVQALDKVKADPALAALAAQSEYAIPQGQIHGSWWDLAKSYATAAKEAEQDDVAALKAALDAYDAAVNRVLSMTPEELRAFTVIGAVGGTMWDTDFTMVETAENSNIWVSERAFELAAGAEFKCRQGKNWDVAFGKDGGNYVVETAGTYKIKLTYADGVGTVELVPAE